MQFIVSGMYFDGCVNIFPEDSRQDTGFKYPSRVTAKILANAEGCPGNNRSRQPLRTVHCT